MAWKKLTNLKSLYGKVSKVARAGFAAGIATMMLAVAAPAAHADGYWQGVQKRGALRCAFATSPPYSLKDVKTGEYGGAYLDLCKQFAAVLGVKIEFVDTTWDNIVAGLQSGKWDMSPALNRTPARALSINFSRIVGYDESNFAYMTASPVVKDPNPDLSSIDQPNVRVGVMSGTAQDKAISARLTKATIVRLPTTDALNLALLSNRIDILFADAVTNMLFQEVNGDKVKVLEAVPALMKQGISFGLPTAVTWQDMQVLDIFLEEKIQLGLVDADMKHWGEYVLNAGK